MSKKTDKRFQPKPSAVGLAVALAFASGAPAWALPTGEQVVAGQVSVGRPSAGNMVIQQGTSSAIVNWNGFSIGGNEAVRIQQPGASSVILNRVLGNSPSGIYGQLSANGTVFLVNPNGVLFGPARASMSARWSPRRCRSATPIFSADATASAAAAARWSIKAASRRPSTARWRCSAAASATMARSSRRSAPRRSPRAVRSRSIWPAMACRS
ncbi:MAG: filamentous hemagglutinin N-terminal domain-containing protein [Sterolibacteriaceae bacterium]|nr:filamentous hemagglutinin N-terminal domain-containing protein [Candidatus Methylophosphatis haderslevensis]